MFSSNTSQVSDEKLYSEDVFSTFLYTGNGSTQTITNGIDLAGKGGLVWLKGRTNAGSNHILTDTVRGPNDTLSSNNTAAAFNASTINWSFSSTGFGFNNAFGDWNGSGTNYASWTFREAPKFFDVVTYTGNGVSGREIAHNLGVAPGCVIIKETNGTASWIVWHRGNGTTNYNALSLNLTDASTASVSSGDLPTATTFKPGAFFGADYLNGNRNGQTYVAYLFAHDATSDGIIQCGSYTVPFGASSVDISLGWEPQWVLIKNTNISGTDYTGWGIFDNMRGVATNVADVPLLANSSAAENGTYNSNTTDYVDFGATGFTVKPTTLTGANGGGHSYIYIAIRRGPMRTPTSGTSVFSPVAVTPSSGTVSTTNFPTDMMLLTYRPGGDPRRVYDRLRGIGAQSPPPYDKLLTTNTTDAETDSTPVTYNWWNTGFTWGSSYAGLSMVSYAFRRAPSFFDEVCYTGTGVNGQTYSHNLGAVPELMIVKSRGTGGWIVYAASQAATKFARLDLNNAFSASSTLWNDTAPTSSVFTVGTSSAVNSGAGANYVAHLFASCPGVSKVGSYTGNGSSQTINCGFAAGARFVMIKRTDSAGDWYVWDTARGIVAGNDPRLSLNSTAAEVTTDDSVDTDSSGFVVNQLSATNINVSSATYIYLAVA